MGYVSELFIVLLDLDELALVLDVEEESHAILKGNYNQFMFNTIYHADS